MIQLPVPGLGVTFAAPWALAAGAGAAAGLVLLHAVTVGRPRPAWLPTARFAPDRAPRAARRVRRPSDPALLAVRAAAALCAGAALARPVPTPERRATARVILADRSGAAAPGAVRAGAGAAAGPGDLLLPFAARPAEPLPLADDLAARARQLDSALRAEAGSGAEGPASLSAALVAARRAAPRLAAGADSIELVIVGPLAAEQADAATAAVRATWGGRARVVRVAGAARPAVAGAPARRSVWLRDAPPDDALAAALALAGVPAGGADAPVRVARGRVSAADRAWARGTGHALVVWPADGVPDRAADRSGGAPVAEPRDGPRRPVDTAYALVALDAPAAAPTAGGAGTAPAVAVAPFVRLAFPDTAARDAAAPGAAGAGAVVGDRGVLPPRVVLRWADGRPAAVERAAGAGCVRTVAVAVPQAGDAALRAGFRALLPALLAPCGPPRERAPLGAADVARLAGSGPLLAAGPLRARLAPPAPDRWGAGLLAAALLALAAEWPLRRAARRRAGAAAGDGADPGREQPGGGPPAESGPDTPGRAAPSRRAAA